MMTKQYNAAPYESRYQFFDPDMLLIAYESMINKPGDIVIKKVWREGDSFHCIAELTIDEWNKIQAIATQTPSGYSCQYRNMEGDE
ncbi:MAG: hypothetical protein UV23_C0023G0013 [Candidatus Nomurabacteria bacterium GW2011_GWF1_42_40]|nr:MAG: hypothetical protein UV23_C0023G0013 [Candidatus Nomurabacteria bacterium GW2011_GWF1_42_40]